MSASDVVVAGRGASAVASEGEAALSSTPDFGPFPSEEASVTVPRLATSLALNDSGEMTAATEMGSASTSRLRMRPTVDRERVCEHSRSEQQPSFRGKKTMTAAMSASTTPATGTPGRNMGWSMPAALPEK